MQIKDAVIIVTGASMGIGRAAAMQLSGAGAKVVLAARSKDAIESLSKELPGSLAVETDMTSPEAIDTLVAKTMSEYGRIDAVINNAGVGMYSAIENVDTEGYRRMFETNVVGPLLLLQKVIPIMRAQGGGHIINISSMVSKAYYPFLGAYASTKYALNALSLTARAELARDNIVVSVVHPGLTDTDFGKNAIKSDTAPQGMESRHREHMPEPDSPEFVAERIVHAIESGGEEIYMHK